MPPLNIEIDNPHKIRLDLGYRGMCELEIHFIDQNHVDHYRCFLFDVSGEKPTSFLLSVISYKLNRVLYAISSDDVNN